MYMPHIPFKEPDGGYYVYNADLKEYNYQTHSFQILRVHYQMPDTEFATTYIIPGTSYQVCRTRHLVPGTWL